MGEFAMKMRFVRPAAAAACLALLGACATPNVEETGARASGERAAGLCAAGETPLFECRIGAEQVAVCGGTSAAGRTYAQYRSGQPGALDLTYPATRDGGAGNMVRGRIIYSGGGETQFHFTEGGDQTIVYSRMIRTGFDTTNNPKFSAGVAVRRNGRLASNRACSDGDGANFDFDAAEPFIPKGEPVHDIEE
jgi:hypothetical protein